MNTELKMERIPVGKIRPAKYNPRKDLKPGDPAYEKIRRSLQDFGYVDPIVWNEVTGNIVGGHQRFKVLKAEGADEVECVVVHIESAADEKALNIALNKATGEWEPKALAELLAGLQLEGYDIESTGFDAAEVDELFSMVHDKDVRDDATALDAETIIPFVLPGDRWMLGRHALVCGDPASADDMERLMGATKANLIVTELPAFSDAGDEDVRFEYLRAAFAEMTARTVQGGSAYVFHEETAGIAVRRAFREAGLHLSGVCVWLRGAGAPGQGAYASQHEPVLYGWFPGGKRRWYGGRKQTTVWPYEQTTPYKPVPLLAYPIRNSSAPNGVVLDGFGGAGGVMIACEQTDRVCRTMEPDPRWASVCVRRWAEFTGNEPTVERDGETLTYREAAGEDTKDN